MNNLTINPASNLRSRDNDINPSEIARGHPEDCTVIEIEGPNDLLRIPTASTQGTIVPIQETISLPSLPSAVWYFDEGADNLCKKPKLPLKLTITERVTTRMWHTEDYQLNPGLYNIAFGISTQFFDASLVDSIIFYIDINGDYQSQIVEVITRKDLKEFLELSNAAGQVGQVCELKLHQQIGVNDQQMDDDDQQSDDDDQKTEIGDQQQYGCKLNIKMEIRFRRDVSPEATRRALSMHHFELHKCSKTKAQDPPMHVHKMNAYKTYAHKPYVWSIDVRHPDDPVQSLKISRYSISGDGKRVATLSATDDSLFLDLWDISPPYGPDPHSPEKLAKERIKRPSGRDTHMDPHVSISVSWDASHIALFPTAEESWVEQLVIYNREFDKLIVGRTFDSHPQLGEFKGEAKFHITNTNNPDTDNPDTNNPDTNNPDTNNPDLSSELFITCNGYSVDIYKVHGQWSHIFNFPVQSMESVYFESFTEMARERLNLARKLIDSLQGRFFLSFSVFGLDPRPLIWDIENRSLLVVVTGPISGAKYPMPATFSTDQSILAILQDGSIETYWTGSNTPIKEWAVPRDLQVSRLTFVRNDTQLLVECTDLKNQERVGYILDPVAIPLEDRVAPLEDRIAPLEDCIAKVLGPGEYIPEGQQRGMNKEGKINTEPQRLYSCHNSKLDFIQLDNIIYDLDNLNTHQCGQEICDGPSPIPITSGTFMSKSGLEFNCGFNTSENSQEFEILVDEYAFRPDLNENRMRYKLSTFSLKISHGSQHKSFEIPVVTLAIEYKDHAVTPSAASKDPAATPSAASKEPTVFFLRQRMLLILCSNVMITVWKLPEEYNHECALLTAHWIADEDFPCDTITKSVDISQCEYHQRLFIHNSKHTKYSSGISLGGFSYDSHEDEFRRTVEGLAMMYTTAEGKCKESIVQYFIENINRYQSPDRGCVILWIARRLSGREYYKPLDGLLTSVLRSKNSRWIPRPDFGYSKLPKLHKPWRKFIKKALSPPTNSPKHSPKEPSKRSSKHEESRPMELIKVITRYCLGIAQHHGDIRLASPITASLPALWQYGYCEVSLDLLRNLAYIPMNDGTQLSRIEVPPLDTCDILNYFPSLVKDFLYDIREEWKDMLNHGWSEWSDILRSICVTLYTLLSVLTPLGFLIFLGSLMRPEEPQPICRFQHPIVTNYFDLSGKKDHLARFDMLWEPSYPSSMSIAGDVDQMAHSWLLAPLSMIQHSFMPSRRSIERHELNLDAFDNPAIEALIEYKWNAFGFYFWLIRFLFQCIYYILVLTVVFVQVYEGQDWIVPLYDTITIFSAIFLWLEFIQFIEQRWKYITSPYNFFDLFVFILPMIGCITARRGGDIAALSFSVIFVFLHFLFELRTNKNVCHYATIIIRIFGELKVFFFIFAGGIIAYAIAILHLLHGCVTKDCAASNSNNTAFPSEPIPALSATYFFIAGIYDPVSNEFANGDWRFRVMMAMFVLFTVVLMLNVLIALINTAFSDGDRTWKNVWLENRLGYIEIVENMSYKIPGFRQHFHHWFYEEICYQASEDQIAAYNKKCFRQDELNEISSAIRDVRSILEPTNAVDTEFNKAHQAQFLNVAVRQQRRVNTRNFGNRNSSDTSSCDTQTLFLQVQELRTQLTEKQSTLEKQLEEISSLLKTAIPLKDG